jgi:hypothetical protein
VTPWNEAIPAGSAPSAANAPKSKWPVHHPIASGTTTPAATRAARHGAIARQRNGPSLSSVRHRELRVGHGPPFMWRKVARAGATLAPLAGAA